MGVVPSKVTPASALMLTHELKKGGTHLLKPAPFIDDIRCELSTGRGLVFKKGRWH